MEEQVDNNPDLEIQFSVQRNTVTKHTSYHAPEENVSFPIALSGALVVVDR